MQSTVSANAKKVGSDKTLNLYSQDMKSFSVLSREAQIALAKKMEKYLSEILFTLTKFPNALNIIQDHLKKILRGEKKCQILFYDVNWNNNAKSDHDLKPELEDFGSILLSFTSLHDSVKRNLWQVGDQDEKTLKSHQELGEYLITLKWVPTFIEKLVHAVQSLSTRSDTIEMKDLKSSLFHALRELKSTKQEMVECNLRLVFSIAKKYRQCGLPFMDLLQEGNIGLIQAVDRFDYSLGYSFATYASWWIRRAIQNCISKLPAIQIPPHKASLLHRLNQGSAKLTQTLGRDPSIQELAEWMQLETQDLHALLEISRKPVSLQACLSKEHCLELEDKEALSPMDSVSAKNLSEAIRKTISALPVKEAMVLQMRFGLDLPVCCTLQEIGQSLNVSRERVRQIEAKALKMLREQEDGDWLKSLLYE